MRILFDTNVLVAAFLKGGASYEVIEQAVHEHEIYYTIFIIGEFRRIFKDKFHYPAAVVNEFAEFIESSFIKGITAGVGFNLQAAESMNTDDDTNVLCLAGRLLTDDYARAIVRKWLETPFSGLERHTRRLEKIKKIEEQNFV